MGIFDFFKSEEEKEEDEVLKILERVRERKKVRDQVLDEVVSTSHNNLVSNGEISTATGRFGLDNTNPIPVKGVSGIDNYFHILSLRKKIKWNRLGSTSTPNINGNIDIYTLTGEDGSELGRLHVCMYCEETTSKIPEGF